MTAPGGRRGQFLLLLGLVAGLAVMLGSCVGFEAFTEARTGHSLDPTDPMNYDFFLVRNDTSAALQVHLCADSACSRLDEHFGWEPVAARTTRREQVYWGKGEVGVYAVTATDRKHWTCLQLDASVKRDAPFEVPLSTARAC
jgi:hypothetical protein